MAKNKLYVNLGGKIMLRVDKIKSLRGLMPSSELIVQHLLTRKKLLISSSGAHLRTGSKIFAYEPLKWKLSKSDFEKVIKELNTKVAFKPIVNELIIVKDNNSFSLVKIIQE